MSDSAGNWKKRAVAAAKFVIAAVVVFFVVQAGKQAWLDWQAARDSGETVVTLRWGPLVGAVLLYMASIVVAGGYWHKLLHALSAPAPRLRTLRAYCIGHLGKYVPGKALVVMMRAGLVRGPGVDTAVATVSVFVETLTMMAVGSAIAAVVVLVQQSDEWLLVIAALGLCAATGGPIIPPVFRVVLKVLGIARKMAGSHG